MIRAPIAHQAYWDSRISKDEQWIARAGKLCEGPSHNPLYDAQFTFDVAKDAFRLIMRRYSRGDPVKTLGLNFGGVLDAWELSNKLANEVCAAHNLKTCRDWSFELSNLNHYNWCFWVIALGLLFDVPEAQWRRLVALVNGEGEDVLLDRIIATRDPERTIGTKLLHKKPYARLLAALDAPKAEQAALLKDFVDHWYAELARKGKDELWWYVYGDPVKHPLEMGSYFGRWCLEAAAAAKVFALDDRLCLGHEHYPGDFLRPDGPTTHPARKELKSGFIGRLLGRR